MKTTNLNRINLETANAMIAHYKVDVTEGANLTVKRAALADHFGDTSVDAEVVLLALNPVKEAEVPAAPIKKEGKPTATKKAAAPEQLPEPPAEINLCEKCGAGAELKRRGKHLCGVCAVAMDVKRKGKEAYADLAARTPQGQKVNRSHLASAFTWPVSREIAEYTGKKAGEVARTVYQYTTDLIKSTFPDVKKAKAVSAK